MLAPQGANKLESENAGAFSRSKGNAERFRQILPTAKDAVFYT